MVELGYHGNAAAGALKRGQTRTLGLLFPMLATTFASFWSDVAAGAEALAHKHGYALLLCDTSDSAGQGGCLCLVAPESSRCRDRLRAAAPAPGPPPRLRQSARVANIPVVVISSDEHDLPYPHVRTDDERAGYVATRHLFDIGRRRIAIVADAPQASSGSRGRRSTPPRRPMTASWGCAARSARRGLDADETPLILAPNMMEAGRAVGRGALAVTQPLPDGIFVATENLALGLLDALRAHAVSRAR